MPDKKRFSDFATPPQIMDGTKVAIEDIFNKEIEVLGIKITDSKYDKNKSGKCLTIHFRDPATEQRHVVFTGSDVLIDQCQKHADQIPFWTTIKRMHRCCVMT